MFINIYGGNHCGSLESINQFDIMILDNLQNKEVK